MSRVNAKLWEPVIREDQLQEGSIIKIVAFDEGRYSYRRITVKKVLKMKNRDGKQWTEILSNKRKNYFFNLTAYLSDQPTWGTWVKELYVRKPSDGFEIRCCACTIGTKQRVLRKSLP